MNKNLLLIAAAVGAYALLRPKATQTVTTVVPSANLSTNASAYVPATTTTSASSGGNWLTAASGLISQGTSLVTQGVSAFDQIKGAFSGNATSTSGTTANVWAGPSTNYEEA